MYELTLIAEDKRVARGHRRNCGDVLLEARKFGVEPIEISAPTKFDAQMASDFTVIEWKACAKNVPAAPDGVEYSMRARHEASSRYYRDLTTVEQIAEFIAEHPRMSARQAMAKFQQRADEAWLEVKRYDALKSSGAPLRD